MQMAPRGAMPAIPGIMQAQQGPPGPMTALLQQEGPPPGLHPASGPVASSGASEVGCCSFLPAQSCAQQCSCAIAAGSLLHWSALKRLPAVVAVTAEQESSRFGDDQGRPMQRLRAANRRKDLTHQGMVVIAAHACREAPGRLGAWRSTWVHHPCRARGWGLGALGSP